MKSVLLAVLFLSVSLISCREPAPVLLPSTSEQLALSIQPNPAGGDPLPRVRISAGSGSVSMVVTQRWMCGARVTAGVNRAPGELAIVVRQILPDSSVVCAPMIAVLDYTEQLRDCRPDLIESASSRRRVILVRDYWALRRCRSQRPPPNERCSRQGFLHHFFGCDFAAMVTSLQRETTCDRWNKR